MCFLFVCMACFTIHVCCKIMAFRILFYIANKKDIIRQKSLKKIEEEKILAQWKGEKKSIQIFIKLIMPPAGLSNKGLRKKALCNIGFFPGRTASDVLILRGAESKWLNLDASAVSFNIWCLLVCLHVWDGLHNLLLFLVSWPSSTLFKSGISVSKVTQFFHHLTLLELG